MTKDEALKLTLDWLEGGNFVYPTELRTAIKEALAVDKESLTTPPQIDPNKWAFDNGLEST